MAESSSCPAPLHDPSRRRREFGFTADTLRTLSRVHVWKTAYVDCCGLLQTQSEVQKLHLLKHVDSGCLKRCFRGWSEKHCSRASWTRKRNNKLKKCGSALGQKSAIFKLQSQWPLVSWFQFSGEEANWPDITHIHITHCTCEMMTVSWCVRQWVKATVWNLG